MSDRQERILEAFRLIILDTERKYDECLVTRLFHMIISIDISDFKFVSKLPAAFYNHGNFNEINISRLLRFHRVIVRRLYNAVDENASDLLVQIPHILNQSNDSYMSELIGLLHEYALYKSGLEQVISQKFDQPVEKVFESETYCKSQRSYIISDSLDLIGYCYKTSKNYHVLERVNLFMKVIIEGPYCQNPYSEFNERTRRFVDDLMESGNIELHKCMTGILSARAVGSRSYKHHLRPVIKRSFDKAVQENDTRLLVSLSTLMSLISYPDEVTPVIEKLMSLRRLEAIIAYVTHNVELIKNVDVLKYIIYPILIKCDTENAHVLIQRLHITREEKIFIDSHKNDKFLVHCFKYINDITYGRKERDNSNLQRKQIYLFEVLLEFLDCYNLSPGAFKNVLQCLKTLRYACYLLSRKSEMLWVLKSISRILKLVDELDPQKPMHVPLIIEYIKLLSDNLHMVTPYRQEFGLGEKISDYFMQVVDLAFKHTNCDILIEFVNLFSRSSFQFILKDDDESGLNECHERYVKLIWHHVREIALEGDHQELPGTLTDLLIAIDLYIDPRILNRQNIQRRRDIPHYLGKVLNDFSSRVYTVEAVIQRLRCAKITEVDAPINRGSKNEMTYLCFLDCNPQHRTSAGGLNYVIRGLCLAAKSEITLELRLQVVDEIIKLLDEFLINESNVDVILKRLVETNIIRTLYELSTDSLDCSKLKLLSRKTVARIQKFMIDKLPDKRKTLLSLLTSKSRFISDLDEESKRSLLERIADFYSNTVDINTKQQPDACCDMSFDTYISDIINQRDNPVHMLECY